MYLNFNYYIQVQILTRKSIAYMHGVRQYLPNVQFFEKIIWSLVALAMSTTMIVR